MTSYKKGIEARTFIINRACEVYNEEGLGMTLDQLAKRLNITKGRITNYFPTKDQLFIAISQEYEAGFAAILQQSPSTQMVSMENLVARMGKIMDLQYQFRSAILFNAVTSQVQKDMMGHIASSFKNNRISIKASLERLIGAKLLKETVLEPGNFDIFLFKFTNLFTTWVINLNIYDQDRGYEKSKPIYLAGILSCYEPYFTAKGKKEYDLVLKKIFSN